MAFVNDPAVLEDSDGPPYIETRAQPLGFVGHAVAVGPRLGAGPDIKLAGVVFLRSNIQQSGLLGRC